MPLHAVVCWGSVTTTGNIKMLNMLTKQAGQVLGLTLDAVEEVMEK